MYIEVWEGGREGKHPSDQKTRLAIPSPRHRDVNDVLSYRHTLTQMLHIDELHPPQI